MNDVEESLFTCLESLETKVDRVEQKLDNVLSALRTLTEVGFLNLHAAGAKGSVPTEVFSAPIAAQVMQRHPEVIQFLRTEKVCDEHGELADLFLHGSAEAIAAEPRLANALRAQTTMEQHIAELFDTPAEIEAAELQSRQMIADTLRQGKDVTIRLPGIENGNMEVQAGRER